MNNRKQKSVLLQERIFVLAQMKGFAVCCGCGCALHTYNSATEMHGISVPASLLFAENSPPGCFRYAKTLSGSNPYLYKKTEGAKAPSVFLAQMKGFAVCCGCALHTYNSATEMHGISVPASLLFAENSPPGCFRYAKTLSGSNPYLYKKTEGAKAPSVFWRR